ncbi:MAG: hypothetical protein U1E62_02325 [Alsobacter sp.]
MIPTADEVSRSLAGSLKLMNRDAEGLTAYEVTVPAFWRSFAAILLTAPAFVVGLAEDRVRVGLPAEAGLFSSPSLLMHELVLAVACWIAFPLAMIAIVRMLGLGHRYVGYIIAWNWSAVVAATVLAVPRALHVIGWATPGLAMLFAGAFGIILLQYRWFLTKEGLGVSGGLAALLVVVDLTLNGAVVGALSRLV